LIAQLARRVIKHRVCQLHVQSNSRGRVSTRECPRSGELLVAVEETRVRTVMLHACAPRLSCFKDESASNEEARAVTHTHCARCHRVGSRDAPNPAAPAPAGTALEAAGGRRRPAVRSIRGSVPCFLLPRDLSAPFRLSFVAGSRIYASSI
jgi:hypothetical protein